MKKSLLLLLAGLLAALACNAPQPPRGQVLALSSFDQLAARHDLLVQLPEFERTPAEVARSVRAVLAGADGQLAQLAVQDPAAATFAGTFADLDDILYPVAATVNRLWLMKETQVDAAMRQAASDQVDVMNQWMVGLQYREDIYRACKGFDTAYQAGQRARLKGEDLKLYQDGMRDYRRAGMELDADTRTQVEALQNELNRLSTVFDTNITDASAEVRFSTAELAGVPQGFLDASRQADGSHLARPTVITDYLAVMQNAKSEAARKKLKTARYAVAVEENGPVLKELVRVRDEIASLLGYASWADYQVEPRMAKTGARAMEFAEELYRMLEPKFQAELDEFRRMKVADTGDPEAQIHIWDFRYYMTELQKRKYQVDAEALRVYFELDRVLAGMFGVFEEIFRLRIDRIEAPYTWHDDVALYMVADSKNGAPLGLFYFDPFPREGKYNHFAQFGILDGKLQPDGRYQRPVVALVCNFTPPGDGKPSLLSHGEVETLFHEFGHGLHSILTQAEYVSFSGTSVPRDFVEAPSQMLENWVWDPVVLDRFAADYRDPSKKIDPAVLARLEEANLATQGVHYRRQLCFALADLRMHQAGADKDPLAIANAAMAEVFLAPPEGTAFAAYWGHLTGYDAGYYGYAWADTIAADLATVFEEAPKRYLDRGAGMRLRNEIYAVGGSRDVNVSIERFLGREKTNDAFVRSLGIDPAR